MNKGEKNDKLTLDLFSFLDFKGRNEIKVSNLKKVLIAIHNVHREKFIEIEMEE